MKQLLVLTQTYTKYLTIIMALLKSRGRKFAGKHILLWLYFLFFRISFSMCKMELGSDGSIVPLDILRNHETDTFLRKTSEGSNYFEVC